MPWSISTLLTSAGATANLWVYTRSKSQPSATNSSWHTNTKRWNERLENNSRIIHPMTRSDASRGEKIGTLSTQIARMRAYLPRARKYRRWFSMARSCLSARISHITSYKSSGFIAGKSTQGVTSTTKRRMTKMKVVRLKTGNRRKMGEEMLLLHH